MDCYENGISDCRNNGKGVNYVRRNECDPSLFKPHRHKIKGSKQELNNVLNVDVDVEF